MLRQSVTCGSNTRSRKIQLALYALRTHLLAFKVAFGLTSEAGLKKNPLQCGRPAGSAFCFLNYYLGKMRATGASAGRKLVFASFWPFLEFINVFQEKRKS